MRIYLDVNMKLKLTNRINHVVRNLDKNGKLEILIISSWQSHGNRKNIRRYPELLLLTPSSVCCGFYKVLA